MSGEDDYELVGRDDLATLRKELEEVKKDPASSYQSSLTLIESMDRLANQISQLMDLFKQANEQMHEDYAKGLHEESDKLDQVIAQNEKLARGILALADRSAQSSSQQSPQQPSYTNQQPPTPQSPSDASQQSTSSQPPAGDGYPLRGPQEMAPAPWKESSSGSPSRRSLMREFR